MFHALNRAFMGGLLCATLWQSRARADDAIADFQTWAQLQGSAPLTSILDGLSTTLETTVRRGSPALIDSTTAGETESPVTYLFVRPSLGYDINRWCNATLGLAWAPVYVDATAQRAAHAIEEYRLWQQLSLRQQRWAFDFASRTRLEERMRSSGPGEGDTELRLRQRFRASHALYENSPFQAIVSDELMFFLNRTDFESVPGFSENRAFVGLGYRANEVAVEFGYLHQYVAGRGLTRRSNHVLSTSMSFSFSGAT